MIRPEVLANGSIVVFREESLGMTHCPLSRAIIALEAFIYTGELNSHIEAKEKPCLVKRGLITILLRSKPLSEL